MSARPAAAHFPTDDDRLEELLACLDSAPMLIGDADLDSASADGSRPLDRRQAPRRPPSDVGPDLRITLNGSAELQAVDVSSTGVLADTTQRLCPGTIVDVIVTLHGRQHTLRARIVRSTVHAVSPRPVFRAALHLDEACRLPLRDDE